MTHDRIDVHLPDPEFAAHLEWQVRTELRRASRFHGPVARPRPAWQWARAAAALVCAVALGAGAVWGAQEVRRSRAAELFQERGRMHRELSAARLEFARTERDMLAREAAAGLRTQEELDVALLRVIECEAALGCARADAEESAASGREPDDGTAAPRIHGRDFVQERLELRRRVAEAKTRSRAAALERASLLQAQGFLTHAELERVRALAQDAERELALLRQRIELRGAFVRGELDAPRAEWESLRAELEAVVAGRRRQAALKQEALEHARLLHERGFLSASELRAAERENVEARAAVELAEIELGVADAQREQRAEDLGSVKILGY